MKQSRQYDQLIKHMQKWLMGLPDKQEMRELLDPRIRGNDENRLLLSFYKGGILS